MPKSALYIGQKQKKIRYAVQTEQDIYLYKYSVEVSDGPLRLKPAEQDIYTVCCSNRAGYIHIYIYVYEVSIYR